MKKPLSSAERRQLKKLSSLADDKIDLSDIPEITDWTGAIRGQFYRPMKKPITIRLDADVVEWLKASGPGYQTRVNLTLRKQMLKEVEKH